MRKSDGPRYPPMFTVQPLYFNGAMVIYGQFFGVNSYVVELLFIWLFYGELPIFFMLSVQQSMFFFEKLSCAKLPSLSCGNPIFLFRTPIDCPGVPPKLGYRKLYASFDIFRWWKPYCCPWKSHKIVPHSKLSCFISRSTRIYGRCIRFLWSMDL